FGYLNESWNDIHLTRKIIRDCIPDDIGISVSYPLPGTKFYENVKSGLKEKRNWIDSDDLDMMFSGSYPKSFYKLLHRFVHAEYRLNKIIKRKEWRKFPQLLLNLFKYLTLKLKLSSYLKIKNLSTSLN
ncbi:MAG: radical SAM protein, partial [Ignavibacteriaceae bacterium]